MTNIITAESQQLSIYRSAELIQSFLDYADVKETSEQAYIKALRPLFRYLIAHEITQPTREDIKRYRQELRDTKKETTVQMYMTACRLFFAWTERTGLYPNIAEKLKGAKVSSGYKKDNLTSGQVKNILSEIDTSTPKGLRDYSMFLLTVVCGLRATEIMNADIGDLTIKGDNIVLWLKGKGHDGKDSFVIVPAEVEKQIREYLATREDAGAEAPLFASISNHNNAGRMTTRSISRVIKNAMVTAGYDSDRLSCHSLRHTSVTLAIKEGNSLEDAQMFARHKSLSTTMIYNHSISLDSNKCSESVARAIL